MEQLNFLFLSGWYKSPSILRDIKTEAAVCPGTRGQHSQAGASLCNLRWCCSGSKIPHSWGGPLFQVHLRSLGRLSLGGSQHL